MCAWINTVFLTNRSGRASERKTEVWNRTFRVKSSESEWTKAHMDADFRGQTNIY